MSKNKRTALLAVFFIFLSVTVIALILFLRPSSAQRRDFQRISEETYDTVFLSMYPIDAYAEEDYSYFRAMTILKTEQLLPDFDTVEKYMKRIAQSENIVSTVYLGIRPDKVSPAEIASLLTDYPIINFELVIAYPSAEYWKQLSDTEYEKILDAYCEFILAVESLSPMNLYCFAGEEWMITNPALYTDQWSLTVDATQFVMTHSDIYHDYRVTPDSASEDARALRRLITDLRTAPAVYPDLSDTAIVFFGDSVIANSADSMSISDVVKSLTNATVYNCGYSGNTASMLEDSIISLPGIVEAFVRQDLSVLPQDAQVYQGISEYISAPPRTENLCFVINYGLNDYFKRQPIFSEDPYSIVTYGGAIRKAVLCLKENYPEATILLCTPTYTAYSETENKDADSGENCLQDYVDAIFSLAQELDVALLDNYYDLEIDKTNHETFLSDMVHPNERGRFLIAQNIIHAIHQ